MSRRSGATKREFIPDPRYNSTVVAKFITRMMFDGKKSISTKIMYDAMEFLSKKTDKEPIEALTTALENVKPVVEVKSRRVGGSTYQVPMEIRESRREALAMRCELLDAFNSTGTAFKKKEDTHKMAEANKAFSHYRW